MIGRSNRVLAMISKFCVVQRCVRGPPLFTSHTAFSISFLHATVVLPLPDDISARASFLLRFCLLVQLKTALLQLLLRFLDSF